MLSPDEARVLDRLTVGGGSARPTPSPAGVRRARARGTGLEFHEYRHYQPGDDPRAIDWTVEARLAQLVVRVTRAVGDLKVHALVDVSASMALGSPSKLAMAAKLAAALCYVAIERRDAAGASTFDHAVRAYLPPATGRAQLYRVFETLSAANPSGRSSIDDALLRYGAAARAPGLVIVLSDFLEPGAGLKGLHYLLHRGLTPAVIQVVAPSELDPNLTAETTFVDIEDADAPALIVEPAMAEAYRRRFDEHSDALRQFCLSQRLSWLRVDAAMPFRQVLSSIEMAGLVSASA
jgi:uncharacterized protein (DUF58 family)